MEYPKFKDWRRTKDGAMVADLGFKKQLWALDPALDVVWDWAACKWEIWRFPGQEKKVGKIIDNRAVHVMTVQTQERTFRELGADILLKLQAGDLQRFSPKEIADYLDAADDNLMRAKEKKFSDLLKDQITSSQRWWRIRTGQVPFSYKVKPSEERLLIKVDGKTPQRYKLKLPKDVKIARAV